MIFVWLITSKHMLMGMGSYQNEYVLYLVPNLKQVLKWKPSIIFDIVFVLFSDICVLILTWIRLCFRLFLCSWVPWPEAGRSVKKCNRPLLHKERPPQLLQQPPLQNLKLSNTHTTLQTYHSTENFACVDHACNIMLHQISFEPGYKKDKNAVETTLLYLRWCHRQHATTAGINNTINMILSRLCKAVDHFKLNISWHAFLINKCGIKTTKGKFLCVVVSDFSVCWRKIYFKSQILECE